MARDGPIVGLHDPFCTVAVFLIAIFVVLFCEANITKTINDSMCSTYQVLNTGQRIHKCLKEIIEGVKNGKLT